MSRIPTICDNCQRVSLVRFSSLSQDGAACPECGAARRVVPSCSYPEADVGLFEELSEAVAEGLAPLDAQRLGIDVSRALWSGAVSETFNLLSVRWASLVPLVLVTGKNEQQQRRVLVMLKTIFEAVAAQRRSGTMTAVRSEVGETPAGRDGTGR